MAVFRVNKNENFTSISNIHLKDKRLSLKAKGLLTMMLSFRADWDYSIAGLVAICKENETAIKSALSELKEYGYLRVTKLSPKDSKTGRFDYVYDIFEDPQEAQKLGVENLPLESLAVEKPRQLSTKESSTDKSNTKNNGGWRFTPPTREEVAEYAREKGYTSFPVDRFIAYYESNGWMVGRNKMKSWKASMTNWWCRDHQDEPKGTPMPQSFRDQIEQENQRMYRILGYEKGLKKEGV